MSLQLKNDRDKDDVLQQQSLLTGVAMIEVGIYGYADTHPQRWENEDHLSTIFGWASRLRYFNISINNSPSLALCQHLGLWRISPDKPTTRTKSGKMSALQPLDHIIVFCPNARYDASSRTSQTCGYQITMPSLLNGVLQEKTCLCESGLR